MVCFTKPTIAGIAWSGDVDPANPATWNSSTTGYIGITSSGTLDITSGSDVRNNYGYIGCYSGSTGEVTVDGIGSTWISSGDIYIGREGSGVLSITSGGEVGNHEGSIGYSSGSTGEVTVDGVGSTWMSSDNLYVGREGSGVLNITDGGEVGNDYYGFGCIGYYFDSTGIATIDGVGSTWRYSNNLYVGFSGDGTLNITGGGAVSNRECSIGYTDYSTGRVTVAGANSTLTIGDYLDVGRGSNGMLNITGGGTVSNGYGYIGRNSGSTGEVAVDGTGSTWISSGDLYVGKYGSGTLNITNGGAVSCGASGGPFSGYSGYIGVESGSTGEVMVNGVGSTWTNNWSLYIGYYGSGVLNITNGGAVSCGGGAVIGSYSGSTGEVMVDGVGSTWTIIGNLDVGSFDGSSGVLNITNGGVVSNSHGGIGFSFGSTGVVTVDGTGSTWTNDMGLGVGGDGKLNITSGGAVIVEEQDICVFRNSVSSGMIHFDNGTLTTSGLRCAIDDLTGTGMINTHGLVSDVNLVFDATHGLNQIFNIDNNPGQNITFNLNVDGSGSMGAGYGGAGAMSISDGRVIESASGYIGYYSGSTGTVTVNGAGSTWHNSSAVYVGYSGSGTLNITANGAVSNSSGYIGYYSGSAGVVTVDGTGSTWTNGGNLRVGYNGSGMLNITDGGLVSVAGTLTIDFSGQENSYINMSTGGMLALFGDADDSLAEFLGLIYGTDAICYWDDMNWGWSAITRAVLNVDYTLAYFDSGDLAGYTMLTVGVPEPVLLMGDADRDGVVSAGDYSSVRANFGSTGVPGILGDANRDGVVSAGDYASVQANFGNVAFPITPIPEPATLSLLAAGVLGLIRYRKWQGQVG